MNDSWYSFDVSPIWVFVALLIAALLAAVLYYRASAPWGKGMSWLLGFLRFGAIFLIILLLLNPLFKLNINETERPVVVVAMDNSTSIMLRSAEQKPTISNWWESFNNQLGNKYEVRLEPIEDLTGDSIAFNARSTNLSGLLRNVENSYESENLSAVVLVSDGIINEGQSPAYESYAFPIYSIGMGDTIPPKDISIQNVRYNKVAYQGNQFPVVVSLRQKGFDNEEVAINVTEGGRSIKSQSIKLNKALQNVEFLLDANESGFRRITIDVESKEGESSFVNNRKDIYVDVIEGKDRILIVANAPHPDISAIRAVLAESSNYESSLLIPGLTETPNLKDFDVVIFHGKPSSQLENKFEASGKWYIVDGSKLNAIPPQITYLSVEQTGNQKDNVIPAYHQQFTKFKLKDDLIGRMGNYPPVTVPFGSYEISGPSEVLLYQKVGSITTDRPLMVFFDDGSSKSAIILGHGIWQWKLQEAGAEEDWLLFKDIVLKTVQYLSIKVNKDRFVVKPRDTDYKIGDRVFIDTEVYNEIYERAYGNNISLTVTDETGNSTPYQMVDSPVNSSFNLGSMNAGVYSYKASTQLGDQSFSETGSFVIRDIQLEGINLTADHNLLKQVSRNTDGQFFALAEAGELTQKLDEENFPGRITTLNETFPLVNIIWLVVLIALMLGTEWALRKYLGAY